MHTLMKKYEELKHKYPTIADDMVKMFFDRMEGAAMDALEEYEVLQEYGCHIGTASMYKKAVELLKWVDDKGIGARWSVEDITRSCGIDFDTKDYYSYDFAYIVNMLYSDYCNVFTDASTYCKMAKNYLEDNDYCGDPSERAFYNAQERIKYFDDEE